MGLGIIFDILRSLLSGERGLTVFESENRKGPWLAITVAIHVAFVLAGFFFFFDSLSGKELVLLVLLTGFITFLGWVDFARWRKRHGSLQQLR